MIGTSSQSQRTHGMYAYVCTQPCMHMYARSHVCTCMHAATAPLASEGLAGNKSAMGCGAEAAVTGAEAAAAAAAAAVDVCAVAVTAAVLAGSVVRSAAACVACVSV